MSTRANQTLVSYSLLLLYIIYSQRTWRVVLGEHDLNSDSGREQIKGVSRVYIHPKWNSYNVAYG